MQPLLIQIRRDDGSIAVLAESPDGIPQSEIDALANDRRARPRSAVQFIWPDGSRSYLWKAQDDSEVFVQHIRDQM